MKSLLFPFLPFFTFYFLLFTSPPPSRADVDPALTSRLEKLEQELHETQGRLDRIRNDESQILKEIETLDRRIQGGKRQIARLQEELKRHARDLSALKKERNRLREALSSSEDEMLARLRAFYKFGRLSWLKMALSPSDLQSVPRQVKYVVALAEYDSSRVKTFRSNLLRLNDQEARISRAQIQVENKLGRLRTEQDQLDSEQRKKQSFLAALLNEKESKSKLIDELERAAAELRDLIDAYDVQPAYGIPCDLESERGVLPWPVRGAVVGNFGPRVDPALKARLHSNGIEIAAHAGTPIHAVCDGRVLFADWFRGYGQLMIVSHGNHYYSVYGRASELMKERGDPVARGEPIALTGEGGTSGHSGLYFEIRRRNNAVDPLDWLQR